MDLVEMQWVWVHGIHLAADMDTWQAVSNTVMKASGAIKRGESFD
jgi:hypothetical protein